MTRLCALLAVAAGSTVLIAAPSRWGTGYFEAASYLTAIATLLALAFRPRRTHHLPAATLTILALPLLAGLAQLATGASVMPWRTVEACLACGAMICLVWVASQCFSHSHQRHRFLEWAGAFAGLVAAYCLLQPYLLAESGAVGRLLSLAAHWQLKIEETAGPFQNRNTYASFAELFLPVTAWLALRCGRSATAAAAGWWLAAALLFASVIASGSRAGAILITAELALILLIALRAGSGRRARMAAVVATILLCTAAAGWDRLRTRISLGDPWDHRREFYQSAIKMIGERPLAGFGLGTFQDAYPRFASFDSGRIVNHVHNDWLETAVEAGLPVVAVVLAAAVLFVLWSIGHWWAIGLVFVFLHAGVDYPLARPGSAAWIWLIATALESAHASGRRRDRPRSATPAKRRESRRGQLPERTAEPATAPASSSFRQGSVASLSVLLGNQLNRSVDLEPK